MQKPLISVIVPVYNAEKTLRRCVDSILGQGVRDFELILVDDGSKDSSGAICDEYAGKDTRVKVIHKPNGGVSSARNIALDKAQGQWVLCVDSDDYISDHFFDGVEAAKEDLLIHGAKFFDKEGKQVLDGTIDHLQPQPQFRQFIRQYLANALLRGPVAKFYRRALIDDLRFPEDMKVGEDSCFVQSYLARCTSYRLYYYYYYYVETGGPDDIKYGCSVDYAVNSLNHLRDSFAQLDQTHHIGKRYFFPFIGYFKKISKQDWNLDKSRWYDNPKVRDLYAFVWRDLTLLEKVRLIGANLLKR